MLALMYERMILSSSLLDKGVVPACPGLPAGLHLCNVLNACAMAMELSILQSLTTARVPGAMLVYIHVRLTAARRSADTPTSCGPRRSSSERRFCCNEALSGFLRGYMALLILQAVMVARSSCELWPRDVQSTVLTHPSGSKPRLSVGRVLWSCYRQRCCPP